MRTRAALLALCLVPAVARAAETPPSWLREASGRPVPAYDAQVPAVVLLDERDVTVEADGRTRTVERKVIKVLTREGRDVAGTYVAYGADAAKVREFSGWLIRATSASGSPVQRTTCSTGPKISSFAASTALIS